MRWQRQLWERSNTLLCWHTHAVASFIVNSEAEILLSVFQFPHSLLQISLCLKRFAFLSMEQCQSKALEERRWLRTQLQMDLSDRLILIEYTIRDNGKKFQGKEQPRNTIRRYFSLFQKTAEICCWRKRWNRILNTRDDTVTCAWLLYRKLT